ncbi:MAG TPA: hypothetical protein VMT52_03100 [Planctomycetota bacterium]|nr:hypothetical protein [Planctomycetota bacterium]
MTARRDDRLPHGGATAAPGRGRFPELAAARRVVVAERVVMAEPGESLEPVVLGN